jgi:hypothetical protein
MMLFNEIWRDPRRRVTSGKAPRDPRCGTGSNWHSSNRRDADTTGAVCGQLAGAYWGESGIPKHWRQELARPDLLETALDGLLAEPGNR